MALRAGNLNYVINIKRRAAGKNAVGTPSSTLTNVLTDVPADKIEISGSELLKSGRDIGGQVVKWITPYFDGANEAHVIVDSDGIHWDILSFRALKREGIEFLTEHKR